MTEISGLTLSFIVMIGLNLLASILAIGEYRNNAVKFLKRVAVGQVLALAWHAINLRLTFSAGSSLTLLVSGVLMFGSGVFFLGAALHDHSPEVRKLAAVCVGYALLLTLGTLITPQALQLGWMVTFGLFLLIPVATIRFFRARSKWLLAALQMPVATSLIIGIVLLSREADLETGGFLYFLVAIFQPLITIVYVTSAVRLSRLEVAEREKEYRLFFDSIMEVFFRMDKAGRVTSVSPSVSQFGVSPDEISGTRLADYLVLPDEFQSLIAGDESHTEAFQIDAAFKTVHGKIDCRITCSPITDGSVGHSHFVGSIRNTHERNLLEQQFIEAQRRESLAVLAGGVAHDFNNILQGILGHAELLRDFGDLEKEDRKQRLDSIISGADTAGILCRQLLLYTGKGFEHKEVFDLRSTLNEVIDILRPTHSGAIRISLHVPELPTLVYGGRSQLGQVFLNLLRNAIDALGKSGNIIVTVALQHGADKESSRNVTGTESELGDTGYFRITVQDDGPGISDDIQPHIFDPFFTTKPDGQGLGLAAVSGILKDHKGSIRVESAKNQGASFIVLIPQSRQQADTATKPEMKAPKGRKRILLVDDEPEILNVASTMLRKAGYEVTEATNGIHALEVIASNDQEFDMMITDIRMPELDGVELARSLAKSRPEMPVILSTGYADLSTRLTPTESARYTVIRKPYRTRDLVEVVEASA